MSMFSRPLGMIRSLAGMFTKRERDVPLIAPSNRTGFRLRVKSGQTKRKTLRNERTSFLRKMRLREAYQLLHAEERADKGSWWYQMTLWARDPDIYPLERWKVRRVAR